MTGGVRVELTVAAGRPIRVQLAPVRRPRIQLRADRPVRVAVRLLEAA